MGHSAVLVRLAEVQERGIEKINLLGCRIFTLGPSVILGPAELDRTGASAQGSGFADFSWESPRSCGEADRVFG